MGGRLEWPAVRKRGIFAANGGGTGNGAQRAAERCMSR